MTNTISWQNEDEAFVNALVNYSLVQGGHPGVGNLDLDPLLSSSFSYELSSDSPCIDAGNSAVLPAWASMDLVGNPRRLNNPLVVDTGVGGAPAVDIGVFEFADSYTIRYGCGVNPVGSLSILGGEPTIGDAVLFGIDNPLGTQAAGAIPALLYSLSPPVGSCGVQIANFGMAGNGAPGALLVGVDLDGIVGTPWGGTGNPAAISAPLPNESSLIGLSIYTQGALVGGGGVGLTDAFELVVGP